MRERTTPLVAREQRAADFSSCLRRSLGAHDVSLATLSHALGVSRQRLAELADPEAPSGLRAADLEALPVAVLRDLLAPLLDAHGLAIVTLPTPSRSSGPLAAARLAREAGEAVAEALEAAADGAVTPAEGARLERECDDVIAAALEVREHAREAQRVAAPVRRIGRSA